MRDPNHRPSCDEIIDILPDPFVIIDRDYRIVAANEKYTNRYGMSTDEIRGQLCHRVSHHSDVPCSQHGEHCPLDTVFETGQATQVMHIHYDNEDHEEYVQLQANPIFDDEGRVKYMGEYINPINQYNEPGGLLVGRSPPMMRLTSLLQRVAATQTTVLLLGESGVGKECVAQYLHQYSSRPSGPFIVVDCGSLGEHLIESELFGYEKGAFTGANSRKKGLFESAYGGTLFIDEIGEMPLALQTKLLRVLETGTVRRVGGTEYHRVDVRIVAATHRNLRQMVKAGEFREDLYYRLSAFPVNIPCLRERKDDIHMLSEHFLRAIEDGEQHIPLSASVIERLMSYDYPGNVRELRNILERAVILASGNVITTEAIVIDSMDDEVQKTFADSQHNMPVELHLLSSDSLLTRRNRLEDEVILSALKRFDGHRKHAAEFLGVSERTLYRHMQRLRKE